MRSQHNFLEPARWRSGHGGFGAPGAKPRRHRIAAAVLASGVYTTVAWQAVAAPPLVQIDDRVAALACAGGAGPRQGQALAVPTATGDASVFRATYDTATASGTLTRSPLVRGAAGGVTLLAPQWNAANLLAGMAPDERQLYTFDTTGRTLPFVWGSLPATLKAVLDRPAADAPEDGLGSARVAYLRGDRTLEGNPFRRRTGLLGDSVHGAPLYLGAGANLYLVHADPAYAAFYRGTLQRTAAVYVGANDGMLHAFDANSGAELFAYVPAMLGDALSELASPAYVHRPYVDGPLTVGEAVAGGQWRSVLVASPGGGAQGLFALDVTDPRAFAGGLGALWEFTDRDDAALGNVMQPAQVARLKVRIRNGRPEYRHFAIVGNGLNSYAPDASVGPAQGALFLLALDKPAGEPWAAASNYFRLDTPPGEADLPAGLGAAALVAGPDNTLRYAYAADLQGNLWRFDFTGNAPWASDPAQVPLFVARDDAGRRQPIVQQPKVVYAEGGGYLVLFGTGSLYGRGERFAAHFSPQSYYAIYDDPAGRGRTTPLGRVDLVARRVELAANGADVVVSGLPATIGGAGRPQGWYLDFADSARTGERSIVSAALADGKVYFATVVPGADACADSQSRQYELDALTGMTSVGSRTGTLADDVLAGQPLLLRGAATRSARRPTGRIDVQRSTTVVQFGAAAAAPYTTTSTVTLQAGRLQWREVPNWRELHQAAVR